MGDVQSGCASNSLANFSLAANLEWLFREAGDSIGARVRAAARSGFRSVEIWGWREKDLNDLAAALDETGVRLQTLIVDPKLDLTNGANHDEFLAALEESLVVAMRLKAPYLVTVAGQTLDNVDRDAQRTSLVTALSDGASLLRSSGVSLLLEPLNSRVDHVGTFLDSTSEGLRIVKDVGSDCLRLLFDAYHSIVMGEAAARELDGNVRLVGHIQMADAPGRHELGSAAVDWPTYLDQLLALGYRGSFGLEYVPTTTTEESLHYVKALWRFSGSQLAALNDSPSAALHVDRSL